MQTRQLIPMEKIRETSESSMPLLLISHGKWFERHLIYNMLDNRCSMLNVPVLRNKKVVGYSHGWFILVGYHNTDECCLFNPISMDITPLPELEDSENHNQCILTKPPTEPDCHILFNTGSILYFCRIGDDEFVKLCYHSGPEQPDTRFRIFSAIGTFRGQIYGFITFPCQQFGSIHFLENNLEFRPIKLIGHTCLIPHVTLHRHVWLIESPQECCCDGKVEVELLMIQRVYMMEDVSSTRFDFRIFRIDVNEGTYVEVLDLGKRTIFLSSNGSSYCCNFVEGVKPNSIYYLNRSESDTKSNDRSFHRFDLEDGCTTSQLLPNGIGYHSLTAWVHNTNLLSRKFLA